MSKHEIAEAAYGICGAYRKALGGSDQVLWEDAPAQVKDKVLVAVRLYIDNPEAGPGVIHEAWMAEKLKEGWVYGETEDTAAKTHPFLVSFSELPEERRVKDFISHAVVSALTTLLGGEKAKTAGNELPMATSPLTARTASPTLQQGLPGMVGIRYIGGKEKHHDNLYGTNLTWTPGETINVQSKAAKLLLAHTDVYEQTSAMGVPLLDGGAISAAEVDVNTQPPPENTKIPIPLPHLPGMSKQDLIAFAQQHYGEKIHHATNEDNARLKVLALIQERGR